MKKTVKDILNFPKYQRTIVLVVFVLLFAGIGAYAMLTGRASGSCTTTVSSVSAAQSAVSSAAAGDTVCMAPGAYGDITLTGSHSSMVTFEPSPVDSSGNALDPNSSAGKVTFSTINVDGNFITVHNFYSTGGIVINNGGSNDVVDHNDVSNTGCGYGVQVYGTQNGNSWTAVANNDVISGNRVHDTGDTTNGCEADAIRIDGYSNLTITGNEVFNIKECPAQNCHTDTLQSYQADVQTSGLTITKNYVHDSTNAQGFPFLKDGDIQDVSISDNLSLRMASGNQTTGMFIDENSTPLHNPYGIIMQNNTYFMPGSIEPIGSAPKPTADADHNVFDEFNQQSGTYSTFTHTDNYYLELESSPGQISGLSSSETSFQGKSLPAFKCASNGNTCNSIAASPFACNATCSNLNRAGDDFELASNPNGIGIDWNPANQVYGPQASSGTTTPPPTNTPPNVSVSAPSNGATVSGTVNLTASATETTSGATIKSVQFDVDNKSVGSLIMNSPYTYSWNTTGLSNGTHTITATAIDTAGNTATSSQITVTVSNSSGTGSNNDCFASPGSCGYPDQKFAWNSASAWASGGGGVGPTNGTSSIPCSSLTAHNGDYNASTSGQTVQNLNITNGTLNITAPNVTVKNVCVTNSGNSGAFAVNIGSGATNLLLEDSTFAGSASSGNGVLDTGVSNIPNVSSVTANHIYITNAAEAWHGAGSLNDSYLQAGATFTEPDGSNGCSTSGGCISHNEDVYLSDTAFSAKHDTLLNSTDQTAVLFGDNDGGFKDQPADNKWVIKNSLLAGGGFMAYLDAQNSNNPLPVGSSTADFENNRFARCKTSSVFDQSSGGNYCSGGADSHGYWPGGGYFGFVVDAYFPGTNQNWCGNYWDDAPTTAIDSDGNPTTKSTMTTCSSTPANPAVSLTAPAANATVSATTKVSATATDSTGNTISNVQFQLDGANLGSPVTTPSSGSTYSYSWNTTTASNGTHTLSAITTDSVGASATASSIKVDVNNVPPTPTTPGNLHTTAVTQSSVSLAWGASTDSGGPGLAGYRIYRGTTLAGTTSGTTFTDKGLTAGTSYSYTVQAYDTSSSGNPSPSTSPLNVTTSPAQQTIAPPQNLNGQAASYSSVSLNWSASSSSNATNYYVVRSDSNNPAATIAILGNVTSYTDNTVLPNTAYFYYIMAGDGTGNYSVASNTVNVTTPTKPNPGPPPTPTNLSGVAISSTQINLSWSAGSPNGDPVAGYNIYRSDKGSQVYAKASGTTWGESGLTPNASYSYTIEAFDSSGNLSSQTGPVNVTTLSSSTGGTGGFLGTKKIGSQLDSNPQGTAEIFQTKSTTSGTISKVHVWIGWFSNNKDVVVGIYKDVNGRPTSLLTKGASTVLTTRSWNTINVQPISITANQRYWIAILGAGDGVVAFRDVSGGTFNTVSASSSLTNLPGQWSPGSSYDNSPLSAYATN